MRWRWSYFCGGLERDLGAFEADRIVVGFGRLAELSVVVHGGRRRQRDAVVSGQVVCHLSGVAVLHRAVFGIAIEITLVIGLIARLAILSCCVVFAVSGLCDYSVPSFLGTCCAFLHLYVVKGIGRRRAIVR